MAHIMTPKETYALINAMTRQITGQQGLTLTNMADFVSTGETLMSYGKENVLNALTLVLGRTMVSARPYKSKFHTFTAVNNGTFSDRMRKISFYSKGTQPSGAHNTDLYTNLKQGVTNSSGTSTMWMQEQPVPLELNVFGSDVWSKAITTYEFQLNKAFRSPEDFALFTAGIMTEFYNEMESEKEAFNRVALLNRIAGTIASGYNGGAVDVLEIANGIDSTITTGSALFNRLKAGTNAEFNRKFFTAIVIKMREISKKMEYRTTLYHDPMTKTVDGTTYSILRHTPKEKQNAIFYSDVMDALKISVLPELFNGSILDSENYEDIPFWQSISDPGRIRVTPSYTSMDENGQATQKTGDAVDAYILGCIFDDDAILTDFHLEDTRTTPLEARKRYWTSWVTMDKNLIMDYSENFVCFYAPVSRQTPSQQSMHHVMGESVDTSETMDVESVTKINK